MVKIIMMMLIMFAWTYKTFTQEPDMRFKFTYDPAGTGNRISRVYDAIPLQSHPRDTTNSDTTKTYLFELNSHKVTIFPNPTVGKLTVNITNLTKDEIVYLSVINISGKVIINLENVKGTNEIYLNEYPNGSYFLKLRIGTGEKIWKVIKEN